MRAGDFVPARDAQSTRRALTSRRRSGLVAALREAAGASGRIVSLVIAGIGIESQGSTQYRLALLAGVTAGVLWWGLVHAVALLLDRPKEDPAPDAVHGASDGSAPSGRSDRGGAC